MSPEQAGLTDVDVDTRTDVYALGVLLYELLVGTQPFDADTLRSAGFGEMCRILREEDPPKPSTRVSTLGKRSDTIARQRRTSGPALSRMLRGDLDWIVIRALEKDRSRRYDSAAAFAADIHRFLNNESVQARPPSAAYRVRKYVARNRIAVTAGLVVLASLITVTIGTTVGMVRARRDAEATRRVAESMAVVFETLNPAAADSHLQSARKSLSLAAEEIEGQLEDQPLLRGRLMMMMGRTYLSLGDYSRASEVLEEALALWQAELGDDDPALGELYLSLGGSQFQLGRFDAARASHERAVEIHQSNLGPDHVSTGWALAVLGNCLSRVGEYEQSRSLLDRAEQILTRAEGPDSDYVAGVLEFKGLRFIFLGEHEAARGVLERSVANHQRWLGRDHTGVAGALMLLGIANTWLGDLDLAEEQLRRVLEINQRAFGHDHAVVATPLRELGRIESGRGNLEAARGLIDRALEIEEAFLGAHHPDLVWTLRARGIVLRRMGEIDKARVDLERALAIAGETHGPVHLEAAAVHHSLGYLEYELDRLDPALGHYGKAGEILREIFPSSHRMTGFNCYQRACIVALQGGRAEAIDLLRRMLETDFVDDTIFEDTDLDSLRGDPEFEAIQSEMRRRVKARDGPKAVGETAVGAARPSTPLDRG
jgi:tetratricopeptide (TPR) repeat protein